MAGPAQNRPSIDGQPLEYRPDIDGLRAVAVLAVVWFHSGLPGLPGGFTGVDVFFVISGYLITSVIRRESEAGRFRFARFYERRFRRIAPALATVTLASMAGGYALLLPYELQDMSQSAVWTVAMASNVYFWRVSNYFASIGEVVPLLHTWSLGVEEQFYLLFPAALVFAGKIGKPRLAVALLAICSLALCLVATGATPAAAFYLLPTRGWELMAGAALAVGLVEIPSRMREWAALAGLGLIACSALLLASTEPWPGWRALVPTVGTALVIGSGERSAVARGLSWRPLVQIGLVSYSFYLWHWPLLVFLREWRADPDLPAGWAVGAIIVAFGLSLASYRWIERPARDRETPFRHVLVPVVAATVTIFAAAAVAIASRGLPQRLPANVDAIAQVHDDRAPLAIKCTGIGFDRAFEQCRIGPEGDPQFLVWGDSHAAAISEAVAAGLQRPGVVISMGACAPVPGLRQGEDVKACMETNARSFDRAKRDPRIKIVVLSAFWSALETGEAAGFWRRQQRVVDELTAAGKRVVVIAGIPRPGLDVPWVSALRERYGRPPLRLACPPAQIPLRGITLVDVGAGFCAEPADKLFVDYNHPSRYAGLRIIAPALGRALEGSE